MCWADGTRASRLLLVCSGKAELFGQLLLHGAQGVLVWTAGGPMVALANTTRHNLLSFKFVHGIFLLVMGIQVLQEERPQLKRVVPSICRLIHNNVQQHTNVNTRLFARNESHEHIIGDCGGSRVWTLGIELRVAKFFPVLTWEKKGLSTVNPVQFKSEHHIQPSSI